VVDPNAGDSLQKHMAEMLAMQVKRKRHFLSRFTYKRDLFTKIGSGQT
jgi:hypothetical protein